MAGGDQDVVREGDTPSECCLILKGYACRSKTAPDGKRQIMSFHIQGEVPDFQSLSLKTMDHGLGTLTPAGWPSSRTSTCITSSNITRASWPCPCAMH